MNEDQDDLDENPELSAFQAEVNEYREEVISSSPFGDLVHRTQSFVVKKDIFDIDFLKKK